MYNGILLRGDLTITTSFSEEKTMSMWGDNDWRQRVIDDVEFCMETEGFDTIVAVQGLIDIAQHMMSRAYRRDDVIKGIYEKAKEDAKHELSRKMND